MMTKEQSLAIIGDLERETLHAIASKISYKKSGNLLPFVNSLIQKGIKNI